MATVISVDSLAAPGDPRASAAFPNQDVLMSNTNTIAIRLQCWNMATNASVTVRLVPLFGTEANVSATRVSGDGVASIWEAFTKMPDGISFIQARAVGP